MGEQKRLAFQKRLQTAKNFLAGAYEIAHMEQDKEKLIKLLETAVSYQAFVLDDLKKLVEV